MHVNIVEEPLRAIFFNLLYREVVFKTSMSLAEWPSETYKVGKLIEAAQNLFCGQVDIAKYMAHFQKF